MADLSSTLHDIVTSYKTNTASKGSSGWIATAITGIVSLILVAILVFKAFQAGKERAKLLHEKAVREEEAHQASVDATLASAQEAIDSANETAQLAEERAALLAETAVVLKEQQAAAIAAIEKLTSWEDIDAAVRR